MLGVYPEYLDGFANNPIRAVKRTGRSGAQAMLYCREDVEGLAVKIKALR